MIRRLYIHNFRCLENFELPIGGQSSSLLIGRNGVGKTTVAFALEILQRIGRGNNRVGGLVRPMDMAHSRPTVPLRLEVETELNGRLYEYVIAFEYPEGFKELRVLEERLSVDGNPVFTREVAQVQFRRPGLDKEARFLLDWHLVALPVVQEQSSSDPLFVFKQWLRRMLILRPMPALIKGDSEGETLQPDPTVADFAAWFSGVLAEYPSAYSRVEEFLKQLMPDMRDIKNPLLGKDTRSLSVHFSNKEEGSLTIPFGDLSDGEKCFFICALVVAANDSYGPILCFWDEPDNYLALSEVGHFVLALRKSFEAGGQFIATSHNPEAIRRFSEENTLLLERRTHLEPTIVRPLKDMQFTGDLVGALIRGDMER